MKAMYRCVLFLTLALALPLPCQESADFARADAIALPPAPLICLQDVSLDFLGSSEGRSILAFRARGSAEGIGGNPPIDYLIVDSVTGKTIRTIPYHFNLFTRGDPGEPEVWKGLEAELARMEEAADAELAAYGLSPAITIHDFIYGWSGAVRLRDPARIGPGGYGGSFRFYLRHPGSSWMRPLIDLELMAYPEGLSFQEALISGEGRNLILRFRRGGIMEFDPGDDIVLIASASQTAQFMNEAGYAIYLKKDYEAALALFLQAISCDPRHVKARYNASCCCALLEALDQSLSHLRALKAIDTPEARKYLGKVDVDPDFDKIRALDAFKRGLAEIRGKN